MRPVFADLAFTKSRLHQTTLQFLSASSGDRVDFNFLRWIKIFIVCGNSASIIVSFPNEYADEVFDFSYGGGGAANAVVNPNSPQNTGIQLSGAAVYVLNNPIVTRTVRFVAQNAGTKNLTIYYQ